MEEADAKKQTQTETGSRGVDSFFDAAAGGNGNGDSDVARVAILYFFRLRRIFKSWGK